jgi:hypothetical protein
MVSKACSLIWHVVKAAKVAMQSLIVANVLRATELVLSAF